MFRVMGKIKSIRYKFILIISTSIFITMALGGIILYFFGTASVKNIIGQDYVNFAKVLGIYIDKTLSAEIEDAESYSTRPLWKDEVAKANLKYLHMSPDEILKYMKEMNKKWGAMEEGDPVSNSYLGNRISLSMQEIVLLRRNIVEIFITDKFGGLVAASGKTSDFYQADEEWWQKAYDSGKGNIFVSNIGFDESSNAWSLTIAVPIMDSGDVIGICKVVLEIRRLFEILDDFQIGATGRAALVDKNGYIIYHAGTKSMKTKFCDDRYFADILNNKNSYNILRRHHVHNESYFVAFKKLQPRTLSDKSEFWYVFIEQAEREAFSPIGKIAILGIVVASILIIITLPISFIFGKIFTEPIINLRKATERIIKGDRDYDIDIKTGDEVEQFAGVFKSMITAIRQRQAALEELSGTLEKKVVERTKDLSLAQEATLNILEDLTEAKDKLSKYSKELEKLLQIKSDFTSTVSHELRTPLAAIKEGISIVLDGTGGAVNTEQAHFLEIAKKNVDRLTRLINDILDFQKLESGKMVFNMQENDINDVIKEAGSTMVPVVENKGIEFILDLEDGLPKIKFDKDKIIQVLTNLINNSVKFTEKGSITICSSKSDNAILVSVIDTGLGISKEGIPKLFQQFEQLEKGIDRKTGGTGLGLAISKEIIERHRGKMWVKSESGKGATFSFLLPIAERRGMHRA